MKLTKNLSLKEAIKSNTAIRHGISNDPTEEEVEEEMIPLTNKMIFDYIKDNLEFDQLIWEFGTKDNPDWVHVSYKEGYNRNRMLKVVKDKNGKNHYTIM